MKRSASATVLCIFQLPAISGARLIERLRRARAPRPRAACGPRSAPAWRRRRSRGASTESSQAEAAGAPRPSRRRRRRSCPAPRRPPRRPRACRRRTASSSKTPIGPFQKTVPAPAIASRVARGGPRADVEAHPAVGDVDAVELASRRVGGEALAEPEVDRQQQLGARADAASASARARRLERPPARTSRRRPRGPGRCRNGKHIAPPISIVSASSRKRSITAILSVTLAPPSTATSGRAGSARIAPQLRRPRARAAARRRPRATWCATPSVEACARCAEPNASLT